MIKQRIRKLRARYNMTQSQFGERIGQSCTQIAKFENGILRPNFEVIITIAREFNVSADYLLGITDIDTPMPRSDSVVDFVEFVTDDLHTRVKVPEHLMPRFRMLLKAGLPEVFDENDSVFFNENAFDN